MKKLSILAYLALILIAALLLSGFQWKGEVVTARRRAAGAPPACSGLKACDAGFTLQSSGHTCTITGVTLATGDSLVAVGESASLSGTLTATWNGNSMTETGGGEGWGVGSEQHGFTISNVTGATGSVVITKTDSGDDSKLFDCVAIRATGLTSHAIDQQGMSLDTGTAWGNIGITTTHAISVIVGLAAGETNTTTSAGTWDNSFIRLNRVGQGTGTCCVIDYAYLVVSATGTYTSKVSGNGASVGNAGYIANFY